VDRPQRRGSEREQLASSPRTSSAEARKRSAWLSPRAPAGRLGEGH
jgi:hypothetical protein